MNATYLVGDVFQRITEIPDRSVDLVLTSPPFLALRSYLPDGHPDKALEIGSEATPADWLDTMLALTAELRRVITRHGSIAVEIGDTYAGSGGAGGDYDTDGLRDGQPRADGSARRRRLHPDKKGHSNLGQSPVEPRYNRNDNGGPGWPLAKSLCGLPTLYTWSLAYGRNLLTGQASPAGQWRVRNLKPWIRSNPPVGALGDKERPATSYITVATLATDRYFDLDAVRTTSPDPLGRGQQNGKGREDDAGRYDTSPGGAPPRDWWHHIDAILDAELAQRAGKPSANRRTAKGVDRKPPSGKESAPERGGNWSTFDVIGETDGAVGAQGVHLRRALEKAGILQTLDALDISPRGYAGAHYAVWPPELCRLLIDEMCPRRVCTSCGEPSRRIVVDRSAFDRQPDLAAHIKERREALGISSAEINGWFGYKEIAKNWERTDKHGAAIPNPDDWRILANRLGLDRERFDDLVLGDRRWAESTVEYSNDDGRGFEGDRAQGRGGHQGMPRADRFTPQQWSDCGHGTWRPGNILDPFAGSGTTLAVATGMARTATGIDIDPRNADLALERVGMFLTVDHGTKEATA